MDPESDQKLQSYRIHNRLLMGALSTLTTLFEKLWNMRRLLVERNKKASFGKVGERRVLLRHSGRKFSNTVTCSNLESRTCN